MMAHQRNQIEESRRAEPRARTIGMPSQHEGVARALRGSFGSVPSLPDDLAGLLDRLR